MIMAVFMYMCRWCVCLVVSLSLFVFLFLFFVCLLGLFTISNGTQRSEYLHTLSKIPPKWLNSVFEKSTLKMIKIV